MTHYQLMLLYFSGSEDNSYKVEVGGSNPSGSTNPQVGVMSLKGKLE
jgi:hypothetical protein